MSKKKVCVVGAGLGGVSAAIYLAADGYDVTLIEKNEHIGGKLNVLSEEGFTFDLGPSIIMMPDVFADVFRVAGEKLEEHLDFVKVEPQWRNFFEDGSYLDLFSSSDEMGKEFKRFGVQNGEAELKSFLDYAKAQNEILQRGFFAKGLDSLWSFLRFYGIFEIAGKIDYKNSMSQSVAEHFSDPKVRDVFDYFIKYVGSSAIDAPGYMNMIAYLQFEQGLWYAKGGLFEISKAFRKLLDKMKVNVLTGTEVKKVLFDGKRASGVLTADGKEHRADYVVSNMEVIPAYRELTGLKERYLQKLEKKFSPACSGIVLHLGTKKIFPKLAHHNFFFSKDQKKHFKSVFHERKLPEDPTLYVVAPTRSDSSQAPEGCDNIKILPHIPPLWNEAQFSEKDYLALKDRVIDKMERMGCEGLRDSIVVEDFWTPYDIKEKYRSNRGSIYGVESNWKMNYGFKAPTKSKKFKNLYFCGGSVNPGGGMPMVILSGKKVARTLAGEA